MTRRSTRMILAAALLLTTCRGTDRPQSAPEGAPSPQAAWSPPADSTVTATQMRGWTLCNRALDSLSSVYQDSFATEDTGQRLKYQQSFMEAQQRLCVSQGLRGGYGEYLYVLKSMANPRNRAVCDSFNVKIY